MHVRFTTALAEEGAVPVRARMEVVDIVLDAFESDQMSREFFGEELVTANSALKRFELSRSRITSPTGSTTITSTRSSGPQALVPTGGSRPTRR